MSGGRTGFRTAVLETTWGDISIAASDRGVAACRLPKASGRSGAIRVLRMRIPPGAKPFLRRAARFAHALIEARAPGRCPTLDDDVFGAATEFRRVVWKALRRIPRGHTLTYAELARAAGCPRAARAAGNACGANPLPLFIPCHRVVAVGGRLGGFSAGSAWKKLLLANEEGVR